MTTYRQIAHRLRIQDRKPEDSERPREKDGVRCYHDEACRFTNHRHPKDVPVTLLELDEQDPLTQSLLRRGAIVELPTPKRSFVRKPEETAVAEATEEAG